MDTDPVKVIDVLSQERDDEHLARSRAEDERDQIRAEVEQMRALVGHYREVAAGILSHGLPVHCAECRKGLLEIAGDADGQQAVQVWDALLEVAEAAQAWEYRRKAYVFGAQEVMEAEAWLCVALDHLRAVRGGAEGNEEQP